MKVGFLGPKGSFSHHVAQEAFPTDTLVAFENIFHQAAIHAVAEIVQPIKQQLLATAADKPVEKIFSHPQAIAQGKKYVRQHYPQAKIEITASTAYAARFVAQHPEENYAAI
uniref:prephenate dehydratase domain-containing protein n=1 Tax=Streptococcus anginosus TaxID=1328 RepID=UPI004028CC04